MQNNEIPNTAEEIKLKILQEENKKEELALKKIELEKEKQTFIQPTQPQTSSTYTPLPPVPPAPQINIQPKENNTDFTPKKHAALLIYKAKNATKILGIAAIIGSLLILGAARFNFLFGGIIALALVGVSGYFTVITLKDMQSLKQQYSL